jgi:opacity protein-like surface antigen
LLILMSCLIVPSLAAGQPAEHGPRLGGVVSGSFGDGGPAPTVGISAGYRFTPRLALEVDTSYMPGLDFGDFPACPPGGVCAAGAPLVQIIGGTFSLRGRAAALSVNVVSELPLRTRRIRPYAVGGAGVAQVRREQQHNFLALRSTTTSTGPMVTMGGGVDFLVWRGIAIGVDLRYQHVFEEDRFGRADIERNLSLTRVGSSVSYRF